MSPLTSQLIKTAAEQSFIVNMIFFDQERRVSYLHRSVCYISWSPGHCPHIFFLRWTLERGSSVCGTPLHLHKTRSSLSTHYNRSTCSSLLIGKEKEKCELENWSIFYFFDYIVVYSFYAHRGKSKQKI